jgi:outer membrane protein
MKNIIKATFILIICLSAGSFANAQKVAYIDMDSLVQYMPESKVARDSVQRYVQNLEAALQQMQQEFQTKQAQYMKDKDNPSISQTIKDLRARELESLYQRIQDFQVSAQDEINKKTEELARPIYDKANKAIGDVAKAKGYKMVLDASQQGGAILYKEPGDNLMKDVKVKLGIK